MCSSKVLPKLQYKVTIKGNKKSDVGSGGDL